MEDHHSISKLMTNYFGVSNFRHIHSHPLLIILVIGALSDSLMFPKLINKQLKVDTRPACLRL